MLMLGAVPFVKTSSAKSIGNSDSLKKTLAVIDTDRHSTPRSNREMSAINLPGLAPSERRDAASVSAEGRGRTAGRFKSSAMLSVVLKRLLMKSFCGIRFNRLLRLCTAGSSSEMDGELKAIRTKRHHSAARSSSGGCCSAAARR
ncbi:unnamed protein product [Gadus morhua 'NCC']